MRTERGDRLVVWDAPGDVIRLRAGAPGRKVSARVISERSAGTSVALGENGDFVLATRRTTRGRQGLRMLRGRTGSARIRRERIEPQIGSQYAFGETAAASAARDRPFRDGRILSSRDPEAFCNGADLVLLGAGRAVARWTCATDLDPAGDFTQQSRDRLR